MKILITTLLISLCVCTTTAQTLFFMADQKSFQPTKNLKLSDVKSTYTAWQWGSITFKNDPSSGIFFQTSQSPNNYSATNGFFSSKNYGDNITYVEAGF